MFVVVIRMVIRLLLFSIFVSFMGLSQNTVSIDSSSDAKFEHFFKEFNLFCNNPENKRSYTSVTECELRAEHNRLVKKGYYLAWTASSQNNYSRIVQGQISHDSMKIIPLCGSTIFSSEIFFLYHGIGHFTMIGNKYAMIGSSLPTSEVNTVSYYYIKED